MATKKTTKKITLKALQSVADDFNSFMEFEDEAGIPYKGMKLAELKKEIIDIAGELVEEDVITQETADTLALLKVEHAATIEGDEEEGEEDEDDDEADEDELVDEDDDEEADEDEADEDEADEDEADDVSKELKTVKSSKKIPAILDIAKSFKIPVPPPYRKDIKKLKAYVTERLGYIADGTKPVKKNKAKKPRTASPYGTGVELMCSDPDLTKEAYLKKMAEKGFTPEENGSAINTAYSAVRSIVGKLRKAGQME